MKNKFENINLDSFDYPIIFVDETLFVAKKNIASNEYKVKFRLGASLKNYLSSYDIHRIEEMTKGDVIFITVVEHYEDFFVVYRAEEGFYLIYATIINILNKKLEAYCESSDEIKKYFNYIFENSENNSNTETKLRKMRLSSKLKRHYAIFNELFFGDVPFPIGEDDIMGAVNYAFAKMETMLNKEKRVLFFDNRVSTTLGTSFSVSDIALVLSSLVVIACTMREKGNVFCSADHLSDELIISVGFIGGECDVYDKLLFSFDDAAIGSRSVELFELLLLKRICEHNRWGLKFSFFSDKTNQIIKLYIPCKETSLLKMSLDDRNYDLLGKIISEELSFIV